ncbi:basic salivary proline-rich protein 1-like [Homarus americanus]|uniref:basic salivary proline-rich protein 1-like n=1 Tax=Homarus americanus TaxID=6706 RepID=UPI001C46B458|nr:basic salivary proline-rich protein 1-like [Homarus americanus]
MIFEAAMVLVDSNALRGQRSHGPSHLPYQVRRPKGPSQERRRTQWPSQGRRRPQGPSLGCQTSPGQRPMGPLPFALNTRCGALRGSSAGTSAHPVVKSQGGDAPHDPPPSGGVPPPKGGGGSLTGILPPPPRALPGAGASQALPQLSAAPGPMDSGTPGPRAGAHHGPNRDVLAGIPIVVRRFQGHSQGQRRTQCPRSPLRDNGALRGPARGCGVPGALGGSLVPPGAFPGAVGLSGALPDAEALLVAFPMEAAPSGDHFRCCWDPRACQGLLSCYMPSGGNAPMGPPICPTRCGALRGPRRNVGAPSGRPRGGDAPKDPP